MDNYVWSWYLLLFFLLIIGFFSNKPTIVILYHVVGTYDDRKTLFVGADEQ